MMMNNNNNELQKQYENETNKQQNNDDNTIYEENDELSSVETGEMTPRNKDRIREELLEKYKYLDLHSLGQHLSAVLNDPRDVVCNPID
jgi:lipopolysaccharide export LptBFGC system permease protein LptF